MATTSAQRTLGWLKQKLFINQVPAYGNSLFYSLGFLGLTCFALLIMTGIIMAWLGTNWWLTQPVGMYLRSVHLWSAQAFVLVIVLHGLVVLTTSAYKLTRRLTWVMGALVFSLILLETEFGYYLRGDFSSQYRALQGADFWNGAYLGRLINTLNHAEVYGIHVIYLPLVILLLLTVHYTLVKLRGIAKPYRPGTGVHMVKADHNRLFFRGLVLALLILLLATVFPSPIIEPVSLQKVATDDPSLFAQTLIDEYQHQSDTATYLDSIDPYVYDTRDIYIVKPYLAWLKTSPTATNELAVFQTQADDIQQQQLQTATTYFQNNNQSSSTSQPLIAVINALITMAQQGSYQPVIDQLNPQASPTYSLRLLSDTGVLENEADQLHITTDQWGMIREEHGKLPPGAWWLAPLGLLNHTVLANDATGDRDGAEILGLCLLLLVVFPFIPYLNRLPEKFPFARWIWKAK